MAARAPTNTLDRPLGGSRGARYEVRANDEQGRAIIEQQIAALTS